MSRLPAYHKAAILGGGLIAIIVAVIGVSVVNVDRTSRAARVLVDEYYPLLDYLLATDRDLHYAQTAVGQASVTFDPVQREAYVKTYEDRARHAQEAFAEAARRASALGDPTGHVAHYGRSIDTWIAISDGVARSVGPLSQEQSLGWIIAYTDARTALDGVVQQLVMPGIDAASAALMREARNARALLALTLVLALMLGGTVTAFGVRAIRAQHAEILAEKSDREANLKRQEFERRLHRGFELVQTEQNALSLVREALDEVLAANQGAEVLMADSSRAHLEQVVAANTTAAYGGCKVMQPQDCPVIRRNTQMIFKSNRVFETCPYLKNRSDAGCSAVCLPVSVMGRTTGVLHVVAPEHEVPDARQLEALAAIASAMGDEIGLIRAFATKEQQANTDSLTGLANRRSLESQLATTSVAGEYAVAFLDIDRFKELNDKHGHEMGDRALRLFADVLRSSLRPEDLVARWGGEEFVLVLPDVTVAQAVTVLERVRERLAAALALGTIPSFTISCGVSSAHGRRALHDVVLDADAALLEAKRLGRDRIVVANERRGIEARAEVVAATPAAESGTVAESARPRST